MNRTARHGRSIAAIAAAAVAIALPVTGLVTSAHASTAGHTEHVAAVATGSATGATGTATVYGPPWT